jgi:molecular chaperone GrpE
MKGILLSEGLEEINPVGRDFDPVFHEALGTLDTVPEKDGQVMDELEKGYLLQGRLLRPSKVRVGKAREE